VVAWILYIQFETTFEAAMDYFAKRRTGPKAKKTQGVGGASQRRYIEYFSKAMRYGGYRDNKLRLMKVRLHTCPHMDVDKGCDPWITIEQGGSEQQGGKVIFKSTDSEAAAPEALQIQHMQKHDMFRDFDIGIQVVGDLRITLYDNDTMPPRDEVACYVWLHTGFVTSNPGAPGVDSLDTLCGLPRFLSDGECHDLNLPRGSFSLKMRKHEIDMAWSDKRCRVFDTHFVMEFFFEKAPSDKQAFELEGLKGTLAARNSSKDAATCSFPTSQLGVWKPFPTANLRTRERTSRQKGLNAATYQVSSEAFTIQMSEQEDSEFSLVPLEENLCIDSGPPVQHKEVQLHSLQLESLSSQGNIIQPVVDDSQINSQHNKLLKMHTSSGSITGLGIRRFLSNKVRAMVSLNKKRFQQDGFDLDLTYITPRLIAMGYPAATGIEGQYRNSGDDVYRFFQTRHSGHFKIVNLVAERGYDLTLYHGSVALYGFRDHDAPALELLLPCCAAMHRHLQAGSNYIL
jgi:hypothetical protein